MSEYSIQFWVMVGTLVTAAGTLILGVGVVIAGLQLKHTRELPVRERENAAVQTYLASKNILTMRAKSARWGTGDLERSISATNLVVSEFKISGTRLQGSFLVFDMLIGTLMKEITELQTEQMPVNISEDPGEQRKELLVKVIWNSGKIVEKLQGKKPAFEDIADELDLLVKQSLETLGELPDGM